MVTKCAEFDVHGRVLQINPGPIVTTFEFKPEPGSSTVESPTWLTISAWR